MRFPYESSRPRRIRRLSALLLCVLLPLSALSGCRRTEGDGQKPSPVGQDASSAVSAGVLTHVFRPQTFELPEDCSLNTQVTPRYDPDTGVLTCLVSRITVREDGDENQQASGPVTLIVETGPEGVVSETELVLQEEEYMSCGLFTDGGLLCLTVTFDPEQGKERFRLQSRSYSGEILAERADADTLFEEAGARGWFHIDRMAVDGAGNVCLSSEREAVVLTPELEKAFSVTVQDWIGNMAADGEGQVWITGFFGGAQGMAPIDPASRSLGDPVELPNGVNELFFGPGHSVYYRGEDGLYFADMGEDGRLGKEELFFNFLNSDLSRDTASVLAVYGPEAVLLSDRGGGSYAPALYRKAADVDLSAVTVLRIAFAGQPEYFVPGKIVAFNRSHEGVRIVTENYRSESAEDWYDGERRLVMEMTAGGSRPDIAVLTQSGPALSGIVKQGLFADLNPFTEKPGLLNRDNIMGCVRRTFTDGEGRLFGLTRSFSLRTVITTDALLGKYAGRNSWTPEELLDFAGSLPADRLLMEGLTRESAASMLLGAEGYAAFVSEDGRSCSFDSELFIRYLRYIASLPTQEEYGAHPPIDGLDADYSERYRLYHEGKIVLKQKTMHALVDFLGAELDFGTKDWRLIGQPTAGDCGTAIRTDYVYVITAEDEARAALAWEALETIFEPDEFRGGWGIPGLVSEFEKEVEDYYTFDFSFTYSGGASWGTKDPDRDRTPDEPGIVTEFTEEDERRIRDVLDNRCGIPFSLTADEDVTIIVDEEISYFLGGVGTAEDCAKKIQSRVSILLAEKG